jgi:hypothetical protein
MHARWVHGLVAALTASLILLAVAPPRALAQATPSPTVGWAGWARCDVTVRGAAYAHQETHSWTMGGTPTSQGAFRVYPGKWSVAGSGSLQRTQGTQSLDAQWVTNVAATSAPLAVFVRASDGAMFIQARHAQLRARDAVQGYQQQTINGKKQTPATIGLEAFEWPFPVVSVTPPRKVAGVLQPGTANGSATKPTTGSVGPMQPAGSQGTSACSWQFGQGSAAPAPPAPVAAQAVPVPLSP